MDSVVTPFHDPRSATPVPLLLLRRALTAMAPRFIILLAACWIAAASAALPHPPPTSSTDAPPAAAGALAAAADAGMPRSLRTPAAADAAPTPAPLPGPDARPPPATAPALPPRSPASPSRRGAAAACARSRPTPTPCASCACRAARWTASSRSTRRAPSRIEGRGAGGRLLRRKSLDFHRLHSAPRTRPRAALPLDLSPRALRAGRGAPRRRAESRRGRARSNVVTSPSRA